MLERQPWRAIDCANYCENRPAQDNDLRDYELRGKSPSRLRWLRPHGKCIVQARDSVLSPCDGRLAMPIVEYAGAYGSRAFKCRWRPIARRGRYGQPVGGIIYGESVAAWWRVNRCKGKTLMQTTQIGSSPEVHRYQTQITWRAGDARDGCRPHNQSANDGVIYRGP